MAYCDLHTHSVCSDGTWTPTQLLQEAERLRLSAIALTDHNTVAGLPEFMAAAEHCPVTAVPGVEFSTEWEGIELHILGLFIQPRHYAAVTCLLEDFLRRKDQCNRSLVEKLNQAGYVLDYEAIKAATPNGQINRAHIGAVLTEKGYVSSVREAFSTILSPESGYYTPPRRLGSFATIDFIKSIGAAAVLAHPFLDLTEPQLRRFLTTAKAHGLDGMEIQHPSHSEAQRCLAAKIAQEFSLKPSGGSDFHGKNKPDIQLGRGSGNICIPMEYLEGLKL